MSDLKELIGLYWDIAYREGCLGVDHDTLDGIAQKTWSEIEHEIERLNARIKDYQDACHQKQELINGCTQDIESLTARIKELEDKLESYQSSDDAFEETSDD